MLKKQGVNNKFYMVSMVLSLLWVLIFGCSSGVLAELPANEKTKVCKEIGDSLINENRKQFYKDRNKTYDTPKYLNSVFDKTEIHYSNRTNTCILVLSNDYLNQYEIIDIAGQFLKDTAQLFKCDKNGVDNVILEKAEEYHGFLANVKYANFLDNMDGGLPSTLKITESPYDAEKCKKLLYKKVGELDVLEQ